MTSDGWGDRFVGRTLCDPRELTPHPENWRSHPEAQLRALGGSLDELGWIDEIKRNVRTGRIFNGHARLELALAAGQEKVPVSDYDLDEAEERKALAAFDPITAMAGAIAEKRDALIARILPDTKSAALRAMLAKQQAASQALLNNAKVHGLSPSRRQYPLDAIFTLAGPDGSCCIAVQAGFKYGINSHGRVCPVVTADDGEVLRIQEHDPYVCPYARAESLRKRHAVAFVDNLYDRYDHQKHLAMVQRVQPRYATTRDLMSEDLCRADNLPYHPLDQVLGWADQLAEFAEHVIVIPKYDCLDDIPDRFVLGFSIPTSHGGTPVPVERFQGRRIHLLGGSWKTQREYLAYFGDAVVSLDNNAIHYAAQLGSYVDKQGSSHTLQQVGIGANDATNPLAICLSLSLGAIGAALQELAPIPEETAHD